MSGLGSARAAEILAAAGSVRALVVGDLMLDRYVSGAVTRVSPEAPVPVVSVRDERHAIGGAANVAANVTALGAFCDVVGLVGDDAEGELIRAALGERRVGHEGVVAASGRPTTVKTRVVGGHQQIVRVDREVDTDVAGALATRLADAVEDRIDAAHVVIVQDYDKGVMAPDVIGRVARVTARAGVPLVVDPKRRHFFDYAQATVFKPNARELEDALGFAIRPDDGAWMAETRDRLGCEHLLLTLGSRGMALQSCDGLERLPAAARGVFDVSGAGDTVSAAVGVAIAAGASVAEGSALANHAAAVGVEKPGVATVSPEEILGRLPEA